MGDPVPLQSVSVLRDTNQYASIWPILLAESVTNMHISPSICLSSIYANRKATCPSCILLALLEVTGDNYSYPRKPLSPALCKTCSQRWLGEITCCHVRDYHWDQVEALLCDAIIISKWFLSIICLSMLYLSYGLRVCTTLIISNIIFFFF